MVLFRLWSICVLVPRLEEHPGSFRCLYSTEEPLSFRNDRGERQIYLWAHLPSVAMRMPGESVFRLCAGRKMQMKNWSPVAWHPANRTWCSLSESTVFVTDTRLHCQMLPPDRTIWKIPNFWELLSSQRVATQLKVLCKQHMLDVWCAELVCFTQSTKNGIEHRSSVFHFTSAQEL